MTLRSRLDALRREGGGSAVAAQPDRPRPGRTTADLLARIDRLRIRQAPRPDGGSTVRVTAYWHPSGFWGLAYWYALVPAHRFLFRGWTRAIARRAEAGMTGR